MLILISLFVLILTAVALPILRYTQRRIAWAWLAALIGGFAAWVLILVARLSLPRTISLLTWTLPDPFVERLILRVDFNSWPFALAVSAILPALLLTALARRIALDWRNWMGVLVLSILGILAVCAGDPYTLMLAWFGLDLAEVILLIVQGKQDFLVRNIALNFASRALGIGFVMAAVVSTHAMGDEFTLAAVPTSAALFLLLAIALRLGVLPLNAPFMFDEVSMRRGIGTTTRLIPAASSLMLLTRLAGNFPLESASVSETTLQTAFMIVGFVGASLGAVSWVLARGELNGRLSWLLSLSSLSMISALQGMPEAAMSWGLACLLGGMIIFLYSARSRILVIFPVLSALGISALPYTPGWNAASLFTLSPVWVIFLMGTHAFLLIGYINHVLRPGDNLDQTQRWVGLLYALGLSILLVTQYLVGYLLPRPEFGAAWWGGSVVVFTAIFLTVGFLFLSRRGFSHPHQRLSTLVNVFSLEWLFRLGWWVFGRVERMMSLISQILEGEGGLLWVLILVGLLITLYLNWGGSIVP